MIISIYSLLFIIYTMPEIYMGILQTTEPLVLERFLSQLDKRENTKPGVIWQQ